MYEFATVALFGLAVYTVVALIDHMGDMSGAVRSSLSVGLGLAATWLTDYSMFSDWGVQFRSLWMGPVVTGLVVGGAAALWYEVVALITSIGRRPRTEAGIGRHIGSPAN